MKAMLEYILRHLVDHPDQVRITEVQGERTAMYEVRCHADDIGKVIGKNGKTIGAIRLLLSTAAARNGRRAVLEVIE
ncbi:MAG: KH domain-containing protein [Kiritimatiellae bacterium]|nr:KH domain-containing protein [Kiritimatiellia bacterium]